MVHRSFLFSLRSSACLKERWRVASSMGLFFPDLCFTGINFFDPFRKSGVVARRFSARLVSCGESSPLRNPGGFRCISPTRTRRLGRRVSVSSSWWWRVQVVARRRRQVVYGSGGFLVLLAMDWEEEVETCSPAPINWNQPVITDVGSGVMISGFVCVSFLESGLEFNEKRFSRKVAFITAGFELKPPPYPLDALEPHMSQETLDYHWGKHHKTYVENLNKQIVGTDLDGLSLEEVVLLSYNRGNMLPAFNNVAQAWNHEFFSESIQPGGGGKPSGYLLRLIERDFGSFNDLLERFKAAAASNFGSGWTWLAYKANRLDVANAINPLPKEEDKTLVIVKTPNAVNPLVCDYSPLLTIDTWEV
ncbi:unnamed protein product [Brassica napus]|uniref:superoxide dismutase n=1 Tax=Brassica napus TaxID=3708 RepID=A0A816J149_BRANA|nr:unnamed protein product [Brassica napus]